MHVTVYPIIVELLLFQILLIHNIKIYFQENMMSFARILALLDVEDIVNASKIPGIV